MKFILSLILASSVVLATGSGWSGGGGGGSGTFPDSLGSLWVDTLSADTTIMDNALLLMGLNVGGDAAVVGDLGADSLHAKDICGNRIYGEYQEIDSLVIRGDSTILDTAYTRSVSTAFETSALHGIVATTDATFHVLEVDAYCRRGSAFDCFAVMYAAYDTTSGPVGGIIAVSDTVTHPGGNALLTFQFDSVATNGTAVIVLVGTLGESFLLSYEAPASGSAYLIYNSGASWEYDLSKLPYMTIRGYSFVDATRLMTFNGDTGIFTVPRSLSLGGFTITGDLDSSWVHIPYLFADTTKIGYLRGNNSTFSTLAADSINTRALQVDTIYGSSPVTFMDNIYAPGLSVPTFSVDSFSVRHGFLTVANLRDYGSQWEVRGGPTGLAWTSEQIEAATDETVWDAHIASDGTVSVLTWRDSDDQMVYWERNVLTGIWSSTNLGSAATMRYARMCVNNAGNVFVQWDNNTSNMAFRRRIGGVWQVTDYPSMSTYILPGGIAYNEATSTLARTYTQRPGSPVQFIYQESTDNGATWALKDTVGTQVLYNPYNASDLCFSDSGTPWVILGGNSGYTSYSYRTAPSTWNAIATVNGNNYFNIIPHVVAYGDSIITTTTNGTNLVLCINENAGGWVNTTISTGASKVTSTRVDGLNVRPDGSIITIHRNNASSTLYFNSNETGGWVEATLTTNTPKQAFTVANPLTLEDAIFYCDAGTNFSYFHDSLGPGLSTGFSGVTARINNAVNGTADDMMLDPAGWGNTDATAGTLHIGNPVGDNDTLMVHGILAYDQAIFTDTLYHTVEVQADNVTRPTASPPADAIKGTYFVDLFDATSDEQIFSSVCLPEEYMDSTNVLAYVVWAPTDGNAGNVTWGISSVLLHPESNEVLTAATATDIIVDATQSLQDELLLTGVITIDGSTFVGPGCLGVRIFRDADASESGASDTYAADASLLKVVFKFPIVSPIR